MFFKVSPSQIQLEKALACYLWIIAPILRAQIRMYTQEFLILYY